MMRRRYSPNSRGSASSRIMVVGAAGSRKFRTAYMQLHPFNRWRMACCPDAPLDSATLARFRAVDIWRYTPPEYHSGRG